MFDTGMKGQPRNPAGDTFEVYQDDVKGRKQAAPRAQGIAWAQQAGHAKPGKPRAGVHLLPHRVYEFNSIWAFGQLGA